MKLILLFSALIIINSCNPKSDNCLDKSKINPEAACTMDYTPVCGCDGNTYSNACVGENSGVLSWSEGECPK